MNRQVLRAILFALPKVLNHTASRIPAFRERLKQRDIVAWIGLQDGSIGRIMEVRNGRVRSRPGAAAEADVTMLLQGRGDRAEIPDAQSRPGRDHPRGEELQGGRPTGRTTWSSGSCRPST